MNLDVAAAISIGDLHEQSEDIVTRVLGAPSPRPFYLSRTAAFKGVGAAHILNLQAPPSGSIWQVRCITMFGNDDHTVVANLLAALYTGDPQNLSLASLKVVGLAIPSTTFIPDTAIWCHPNENVCINFSDVIPAGQMVGANIVVEEWKERDVSRNSGK